MRRQREPVGIDRAAEELGDGLPLLGGKVLLLHEWNQSGLQWRQGTPGKDARTMGPEVSEKPLRFSAPARRIFGSSYETLKPKRL